MREPDAIIIKLDATESVKRLDCAARRFLHSPGFCSLPNLDNLSLRACSRVLRKHIDGF
jgi:hypothetical protein